MASPVLLQDCISVLVISVAILPIRCVYPDHVVSLVILVLPLGVGLVDLALYADITNRL